MNLPGASFLRERSALRAFETQPAAFRELVFYSEGPGDWPHLGPVVERMLADHDQPISYLSSDPADPGLRIDDPRVRGFLIGSGTARTVLFARLDCRHFVMTMPDLESLWLKRSVHAVHYIYLFHSINSTHTSYRKGAFDAYDTILCVGPHHADEIRRTEAHYGLPAKELIEHGSSKLDAVVELLASERDPGTRSDRPTRVLVAPTWGESSLLERPVGRKVIEVLLGAGNEVVLRPHPMTSRRSPALIADIRRSHAGETRFAIEEDMSATESWLRSDVMVSDWSGAATEYAFALQRPVIYVDTPQKILNPEWDRIGLPAFEDAIRREVGQVVDPADVTTLPGLVAASQRNEEARRARVLATREASIHHLGGSTRAATSYLASVCGRP